MNITDVLPPSAFRFTRKAINLAECLRSLEVGPYLSSVRIDWIHELSASDYDAFVSGLLADAPWLDGLGGNAGPGIIRAILVSAPDRPPLLVDPQGYSYARYVGLLVEHADAYRTLAARLNLKGL